MNTFNWQTISKQEITACAGNRQLTAHEHAARKTHIIIPENAVLELPPLLPYPGISIIEITQKKSSRLSLFYLHDAPEGINSQLIIRTTLEENASLQSLICIAGMANTGLILETNLVGEGSSVKERTLYFGSGSQELSMFSNTTLSAENCTAEIESKGILTGRAKGRFNGNISVRRGAKKSNARLTEHTLLLSNEAQMNAIPGLKIETNDVTASHSASMSRISEEQLFYCESRGIEQRDATRLIAEGFLKIIYEGLPHEKKIASNITAKLCLL